MQSNESLVTSVSALGRSKTGRVVALAEAFRDRPPAFIASGNALHLSSVQSVTRCTVGLTAAWRAEYDHYVSRFTGGCMDRNRVPTRVRAESSASESVDGYAKPRLLKLSVDETRQTKQVAVSERGQGQGPS